MKIFCDCGIKISSAGRYWGVELCGKCQRLEREARRNKNE